MTNLSHNQRRLIELGERLFHRSHYGVKPAWRNGVARILGVSPSFITRCALGQREPSDELIERLEQCWRDTMAEQVGKR